MQSKLRFLTLLLILTISIPFANSATPPKPGAKCAKLGSTKIYKGKQYICVKSGGKRIWSKGSVVTKGSDSSNPLPGLDNFKAWNTEIDAKTLSDQAQRNFISWTKSNSTNPLKHDQIIQENANSQRVAIMKKADDLSAQLFSSYFPSGSVTVIGASESWTNEELLKKGWNTACQGQSMPGVAYCKNFDRHNGYVVTGDKTYDSRNPGSDGGALLAHVYFHLVQANLAKSTNGLRTKSGDSDSINAIPAWFLEGTADFVGFSVAALSQNASYWIGRPMMLSYAPPQESINKNSIADYEIRICCGNDTPTYPYNIGQVATEFIVASIGFQKMIDIWIDYGATRNFEKSFKNITGISKLAFYEKFDQLRTRVGLPAISWKLDGLVNKKIAS